MKKWKLLSLIAVSFLAACSTDTNSVVNNTTDTDDGAIIPSDILFSSPSSISSSSPESGDVTLAKFLVDSGVDENISLYDFYKPVPIYISLAEDAKNGIKNFINELHQYDIPDNFDEDVDEKIHIKVDAIDTLSMKLYRINITSIATGERVLAMKYFRNSTGNYKGSFYYSDILDENQGNKAFVHFNGIDEVKKMTVIYKNESGLYGDKHKDDEPSAIMVRTVKRGDMVVVKGISFHPTFTDSFLTEGENVPSIYAFRAAANVETNKGVLQAALAPKETPRDSIFSEYSLDKVILNAGVRAFKEELRNDSQMAEGLLLLMRISSIDEINGENLKQLLDEHPEFMENDEGLQEFYSFISLKQPIYVGANARLIGFDSELEDTRKEVDKSNLEDSEIEDIDVSILENFDMDNGTDEWTEE